MTQTAVVAIDDDPDMLHMIRAFLGRHGISVRTYSSGVEAFASLGEHPIDCILLDMNLAEESGTDISAVIRSTPTLKDTPIIFLSGDESQEGILRALEAGANDYLRKPFHTRELIARIEAHVRLSQQRRQLQEKNELLEKRNQEALILNTRAVMLQEVIKQYTPRSTWEKADFAALEGMIEIPNEEVALTLLFLDIKSFTSYAEQHTAAEVIESLNEFFGPITTIIDRRGGDIDKFIGDAVFAIFPNSLGAVTAGWEIQQSMQAVNARRRARGLELLHVRVGLNRGTVVRGNVGGQTRKENTLIGDAVNVASRIEKACAPGRVLISEIVAADAGASVQVGPRLLLKAKGKAEPLVVFYVESVEGAGAGGGDVGQS